MAADEEQAMVVNIKRLSMEMAGKMAHAAIDACRKQGKYVGICGQGPSDHADLARWLLDQGIESMSLNPDTVIETWMFLAGEKI